MSNRAYRAIIVRGAEPLAAVNDNRIMIRCPENLGTIRSDETKVRHIVLNLLANACKFTKRGEIELRAESRIGAEKDLVSLSISDTGIGMSREQLGQVFDEFTQADSTTTCRYGGTGLGLAISRRLCELLGGTIEVNSELGVGTTFSVRLPVPTRKTATAG